VESDNQESSTDTDWANGNGAHVTWDSSSANVYTLAVFGHLADTSGTFGIAVSDFEKMCIVIIKLSRS
jgi:hypothetical protein